MDCGGSICDACADGLACVVDGDCSSNSCVDNVCTTPTVETCSDGITNQDETDVDCGGSICDACTNGLACLVDSDCSSDFCNNNVCDDRPTGECPNPTVVIDTCDSGVADQVLNGGCITDAIAACASDVRNHGRFVSCTARLTGGLVREGLITGEEKDAIMSCAGMSDIGK